RQVAVHVDEHGGVTLRPHGAQHAPAPGGGNAHAAHVLELVRERAGALPRAVDAAGVRDRDPERERERVRQVGVHAAEAHLEHAPDYIGHHPGGAFMEMQFYPPGWSPWEAGVSCDATRWCAALTIDSFSVSQVDSSTQNQQCFQTAGVEPVSFAFITKNGVPQ